MRVRSAPTAFALVSVLALASAGPLPAPASGAEERGWVVDKVRFEPAGEGAATVTAEGVGTYRGAIEVAPGGGGLAVINDVGVEDYVKGVAEVPPQWPAAAQRAQAIAARTYALHQKANAVDSPWRAAGADICPTQDCQVYIGVASEQRPGGANWVAAVNATARQVLLSGGKPILALYSSSNGGRSASGGKPYLRAVNDPDDARSGLNRWSHAVPLAALVPLLGVAPPFTLVNVGRDTGAVMFTVKDPAGALSQRSMAPEDFRARANGALGAPGGLPSALPSPRFTLKTSADKVVFEGGGWGHGVGMSQHGAYGKAVRGMSASDILAAYYGGIRPATLGPDQLPPTIRVAVALGRGGVTVAPERHFRVVTGSGETLGHLEVGRWRVVPAKGGVRVVPPEGRDRPLAAEAAVVEPPPPGLDTPLLRFDLSAPAVVTVRYVTPTGLPGALPPKVVDAGEVVERLPRPSTRGDYNVMIEADGGPGRFLSVPLTLRVDGPDRMQVRMAGAGPPEPARSSRAPVVALAVLLLATTTFGQARARRRRKA
ncbi:MAG TPA: SpoIID/LytB domain-containing protein [Acidimicrobiales bacterium]|nr:SpoIID/LytB domain-containing protein [Acidimicrobiales bacterium]